MNKEQAYDELISPLMTEIVRICQENKISMLATFDIPIEEDEGLCCTTYLPDETGELSERIQKLAKIARPINPAPFMLRTKQSDGTETITAFL
jgi:hypothetical protein